MVAVKIIKVLGASEEHSADQRGRIPRAVVTGRFGVVRGTAL